MDISTMCNMARELTNTNSTDFTDARILPFINVVKDDLFAYLITGINEDYNWDKWWTTSVANQTEYVLPEAASDTEGNLKINGVSINYDGETYPDGSMKYTKARLVKLNNLKEDWSYYTNYQSQTDPIFYVADKSIFIAPQPTASTAGTRRIELKGIKSIIDYTVDTTEANIKLPTYLHQVIVQGVLPYIHRAEGRKDEASFEEKKYMEDRNLAVLKFSNRVQAPYYLSYPDEREQDDFIKLN